MTKLRVTAYGPDVYQTTDLQDAAEIERYLHRYPVVWIACDYVEEDVASHLQIPNEVLHPALKQSFALQHNNMITAYVPDQLLMIVTPRFLLTSGTVPPIEIKDTALQQSGLAGLAHALLDHVVDQIETAIDEIYNDFSQVDDTSHLQHLFDQRHLVSPLATDINTLINHPLFMNETMLFQLQARRLNYLDSLIDNLLVRAMQPQPQSSVAVPLFTTPQLIVMGLLIIVLVVIMFF